MDEKVQIKMVWYLEGRWFRGRQLLSCWQSTAEFPIPGKHHHLIANHTKRQTKLLPTLSSSACFRLPGIEKISFWAFIFASHTKVLELKQTCPAASVFVPPKGWLRNRRGVAFWNLHQRSSTTWSAFYKSCIVLNCWPASTLQPARLERETRLPSSCSCVTTFLLNWLSDALYLFWAFNTATGPRELP